MKKVFLVLVLTVLCFGNSYATTLTPPPKPPSTAGQPRWLAWEFASESAKLWQMWPTIARERSKWICEFTKGVWMPAQGVCLMPPDHERTCKLMCGKWTYLPSWKREVCVFPGGGKGGNCDPMIKNMIVRTAENFKPYKLETSFGLGALPPVSQTEGCDIIREAQDYCRAKVDTDPCTPQELYNYLATHLSRQMDCNLQLATFRARALCLAWGGAWYEFPPGTVLNGHTLYKGEGMCTMRAVDYTMPACVMDPTSATEWMPPCSIPDAPAPSAKNLPPVTPLKSASGCTVYISAPGTGSTDQMLLIGAAASRTGSCVLQYGDGTQSTWVTNNLSTSHKYTVPGEYTLTATCTTTDGTGTCTDTHKITIDGNCTIQASYQASPADSSKLRFSWTASENAQNCRMSGRLGGINYNTSISRIGFTDINYGDGTMTFSCETAGGHTCKADLTVNGGCTLTSFTASKPHYNFDEPVVLTWTGSNLVRCSLDLGSGSYIDIPTNADGGTFTAAPPENGAWPADYDVTVGLKCYNAFNALCSMPGGGGRGNLTTRVQITGGCRIDSAELTRDGGDSAYTNERTWTQLDVTGVGLSTCELKGNYLGLDATLTGIGSQNFTRSGHINIGGGSGATSGVAPADYILDLTCRTSTGKTCTASAGIPVCPEEGYLNTLDNLCYTNCSIKNASFEKNVYTTTENLRLNWKGQGNKECVITATSPIFEIETSTFYPSGITPNYSYSFALKSGIMNTVNKTCINCNEVAPTTGKFELRCYTGAVSSECSTTAQVKLCPRGTKYNSKNGKCISVLRDCPVPSIWHFVHDDGAKKLRIRFRDSNGRVIKDGVYTSLNQKSGDAIVVHDWTDPCSNHGLSTLDICLAQDSCSGKYCDTYLEYQVSGITVRFVSPDKSSETKEKSQLVMSVSPAQIANAINVARAKGKKVVYVEFSSRTGIGDDPDSVLSACK